MTFNNGIPTGIDGFDNTFGGIKGDGLTIFTHFDDFDVNTIAKFIACNATYIFQKNVLFFSAKDTVKTMFQAMEEYESDIDIRTESLSASLQFDALPMDFDAFIKKVKDSQANHTLDLVIINDVQFMGKDLSDESLGKLIEKLHYFVLTNNIPTIITVPNSKHPEFPENSTHVDIYGSFMIVSNNERGAAEIQYDLKKPTAPDNSVLKSFSYVNCNNLNILTLPKHIKEVEAFAFVNCPHLSYVECEQELTKVDKNAFVNCPMVTEGIVCTKEEYA